MNKLKMTLKNISLRWKFFFGFLITSLVPIVGFGVYAYTNTEKILLEQSYGNMEENLARASNNMDMVLDGYESASSLIFMNKQVQDLISVDFTNYGYEDLYYYLKNYFGTMMAINSDVNTFSIYTTNQTIAQDYYFIYKVTEEIEQEEWYRRARAENGKSVFMRGGVNKDGNYVFYLVRSLDYYSYGSLRNVLRMEIDEKHLLGVISEVSRDDEMMILDEENHVVSCADKSLTGRSIYDILEGYEGEIGNNRRDTAVYDGKEMLVSSVTSPQGWKILSLVSVPMLEMNIRTSVKNVIMFGLLAIGMSLVFSAIISILITRRIKELTKSVEKMKDGVFGERIEDGGRDEIGILAEVFSDMSLMVKHLIKDIYEKELIRKAAELNLLQEQINPHFLYNVLSSITSMAIRSGNSEISDMVDHLALFYRISLNKGKNILTVREEVKLLENYLEIQKVRFGDAIQITCDLDENLMDCLIIKLILQPIVENAIHHAMKDETEVLHIAVTLKQEADYMVFTIIDDGVGMDENTVKEINSEIRTAVRGFGLKNVSIRIQLQYGQDYGVKVYSKINEGTRVLIKLPIVRSGEKDKL
ncbi:MULTISPECIES: cache domain-containing sensor histidine kinase [Eisenbergiella]|uniref:histidine kinase n=1 Tax=Eisenbergiella porci TaxID=2652274 RepID=A0A6N7W6B0_9FIRM|nr:MULTISPECIES: sensor histidine kinase [Eisenbergiella]MDY2651740.1 sensor histidine kinase [Eisenbergiella porci]MSS90801.1 sensor histidine kinase [Eisenbergiella porci]